MDDMEARMRRVEQAVVRINHFTESFPELMEAKFDGLNNTFKEVAKSNADKIAVNRRLLYGIITAVVGGAIAVLWSLAQVR